MQNQIQHIHHSLSFYGCLGPVLELVKFSGTELIVLVKVLIWMDMCVSVLLAKDYPLHMCQCQCMFMS